MGIGLGTKCCKLQDIRLIFDKKSKDIAFWGTKCCKLQDIRLMFDKKSKDIARHLRCQAAKIAESFEFLCQASTT